MNRKLELLMDIDKVCKAIDKEVDNFILSRIARNKLERKIFNVIYEDVRKRNIRLFRRMTKKYGN